MNTRQAIGSLSSPVALSVSFNQDASRFAVGLDDGFCIFGTEPCQLQVQRELNAGIGTAEMLGQSNFVAILGGGLHPKFSQNKVIIWDDAKQKVAIQLSVLTTVRGVRLSRTHIVVVLHNSIRVYLFKNSSELCSAFETANNPLGLCCLTLTSLAFPGRTPGQVQFVELSTGNVSIIPAHSSALRAIDISRDGEILATASQTGTLIRIFATSNCAQIAELRRGVDHATIFSVAIAPSGQMLAVTSDKSTLHIFDISHPKRPKTDVGESNRRSTVISSGTTARAAGTSQKWGILGRLPLLPRVFSDVYSFASAHFEMGDEVLPDGNGSLYSQSQSTPHPPKGIVGWTSDSSLVVLGAGRDGRWEKFTITTGEDGKRFCFREGWKRYLGVS